MQTEAGPHNHNQTQRWPNDIRPREAAQATTGVETFAGWPPQQQSQCQRQFGRECAGGKRTHNKHQSNAPRFVTEKGPNPTKTNYSIFYPQKPGPIQLTIQNTTLKQNNQAPLLGITVQYNLKHNQTIANIIKKLWPFTLPQIRKQAPPDKHS